MRKLSLRKIKDLSSSHTASRQQSQGSKPLCHVAFHPTCQPFTAASSSDCSMLPSRQCLLLLDTSHHVLSQICSPPSLIRLGVPWGRDMFYLSLYPGAHLSTWPRICVLNNFCWLCCIGFFYDSCWLMLLKSHIPSTQTHLSCNISTYSWVLNGVMCILWY